VAIASVQSGTPIGVNSIGVTVRDKAGNSTTVTGTLDVVSKRSNRNYFLFPGFNLMGLALIPDDVSMDNLMDQDISDLVSDGFKSYLATTTVALGDVVESTFAFNRQGNFLVHTPGAAADTLEDMDPFQGMNINVKTTVGTGTSTTDVFKKVAVSGFTAKQAVPIRVNISGVFVSTEPGVLPPDLEMRVGYNLIAPHILDDSAFERVFRGALVPVTQAISALSFERRVDATSDADSITAQIFEGFVTKSVGDQIRPEMSYWTFIASNPGQTVNNIHGDELGPTIVTASSGD
jgi:hypothetical protein